MNISKSIKKQSGVILLVSMVFLAALTMMGVTSMQGSLTELTMAGNLRESGLTFQAAEAGLKSAESIIENSTSTVDFDGSSVSMLGETDDDPNYLDATSWAAASTANVSLSNISANPQYIIRYLGDRNTNQNASVALGGYGADQSGTILSNFRVTSRGSGQTGNIFKVVQSYYAKEYN